MTAVEGIPCLLMRGGTSKGAYFLASDLPADPDERDELLLRIMGTPDPRQIDGLGGAHPLTSKVAVISPSPDGGADVDYLFLQLGVDTAFVTSRQNCGNILAGVGPFALERGLVPAGGDHTEVRIRMINTNSFATARFATPAAWWTTTAVSRSTAFPVQRARSGSTSRAPQARRPGLCSPRAGSWTAPRTWT